MLAVEQLGEEEMQRRITGATATAHAVETGGSHHGSRRLGHAARPGPARATAGREVDDGAGRRDTGSEVFKAYAPYLIIIVVFSLAQIGPIKTRC